MKVSATELPEVKLIEPAVFGDQRGYFYETWQRVRYAEAGVPATFVQDNVSRSRRGVLRGLHLQHPHAQGKLVFVLDGGVFGVAVDVRRGSPWFGRWVGLTLSAANKRQLYIPPGFAHGFCVTSENALFAYKCTEAYHLEAELGVAWNDPALAISWPIERPELSDRDRASLPLAAISPDRLPVYANRGV